MKCPKCGYNSFEFLDQCKKCNADLVAFKQANGIRPVFLSTPAVAEGVTGHGAAAPVLPIPPAENGPEASDLPFSWEEDKAETKEVAVPASVVEEGGGSLSLGDDWGETNFGDLLESSSTLEKSAVPADKPAPAVANGAGEAAPAGTPGEFELDFFGEASKETTTSAVPAQPQDQQGDPDFDFLFEEPEKK